MPLSTGESSNAWLDRQRLPDGGGASGLGAADPEIHGPLRRPGGQGTAWGVGKKIWGYGESNRGYGEKVDTDTQTSAGIQAQHSASYDKPGACVPLYA